MLWCVKCSLSCVVVTALLLWPAVASSDSSSPKLLNVLLIIADDLRPQLGVYQDPEERPSLSGSRMITPHIDQLASESLLLKNAYAQQAMCSPSRSSFLTSRRGDTTRVYSMTTYFRKVGGNFTTLPQYFMEHGYASVGMGKVFEHKDQSSWSEEFYKPPNKDIYNGHSGRRSWQAVEPEKRHAMPLPDEQIMMHALNKLDERVEDGGLTGEKPFFMCVGFYKPHLPFVFPEEFLELYPEEHVSPPIRDSAPIDMPVEAWNEYSELRKYSDIMKMHLTGKINTTGVGEKTTQDLRRAYFATTSYVDALVGKLLWHLHTTGLERNTVVAFIGDHGFVLGEHGRWGKHVNLELDTHTPMMMKVPGRTDGGIVTDHLVELVDLFPTLVEAAGLDPMPQCSLRSRSEAACTEGSSLMPLVDDPDTEEWKSFAFSQYPVSGDEMGYNVRSKRFRYTEWLLFKHRYSDAEPDWDSVYAKDLYDYQSGSEGILNLETRNVVDKPKYKKVVEKLSQVLRDGWRKALPGRK